MDKIKPWILAARPRTLFAALAPIIVGLSLSFQIFNKQIDWLVAIMTIIAAVLIQIGSNYANDAYDYLKGADNKKIAFIHPHSTPGILLELCQEV